MGIVFKISNRFIFKVEGRLPPKGSSLATANDQVSVVSDGTSISVDRETLTQLTLLKQMKESFSSASSLQAMMIMMAGGKSDGDVAQALEMAKRMQAAQAAEPSPATMSEAVAGPSGGLTFPAVNNETTSQPTQKTKEFNSFKLKSRKKQQP